MADMKYVPALLLSITLLSCDRPKCTNSNAVLLQHAPESNEYKAELIKQLNAPGHWDVAYWIDGYTTSNGREYMIAYIQDVTLCAKALLDITKTDELKQFKKVAGKSYSGARLRGLKYRIDSTNGNYDFVFEHVSWIED
jgi:hypothetical protein